MGSDALEPGSTPEPALTGSSTSIELAVGDSSSLSVDDLCAAVMSAGYSATPLVSGDPAS